MTHIENLRDQLPECAKDIRLNLQPVLTDGSLTHEQRWGVAVAVAVATRNPRLREAVLAEAREQVAPAVIEDGLAAATLMGMNNVYYRFRHMVGKPGYSDKPARLRMGRLARPATNRTDLELFSLAVSAINGCEQCVRSHEQVVIDGGLTEDQVHDAVRLAATLQAAAVALEISEANTQQ